MQHIGVQSWRAQIKRQIGEIGAGESSLPHSRLRKVQWRWQPPRGRSVNWTNLWLCASKLQLKCEYMRYRRHPDPNQRKQARRASTNKRRMCASSIRRFNFICFMHLCICAFAEDAGEKICFRKRWVMWYLLLRYKSNPLVVDISFAPNYVLLADRATALTLDFISVYFIFFGQTKLHLPHISPPPPSLSLSHSHSTARNCKFNLLHFNRISVKQQLMLCAQLGHCHKAEKNLQKYTLTFA